VLQGTSHRITADYAKLEQRSCTEHVSNSSLHIIARIMAGHRTFLLPTRTVAKARLPSFDIARSAQTGAGMIK